MQVQYLHCNNTWGNVAFKKPCKQEGLGVEFEYTAPGMPQQSSCIEQKIATLFTWVHTMLNNGMFNTYLKNGLRAKTLNNITFCTLLLMVIQFGYSAKTVKMEIAFVYRDLKEQIYMDCPQSMSDIG